MRLISPWGGAMDSKNLLIIHNLEPVVARRLSREFWGFTVWATNITDIPDDRTIYLAGDIKDILEIHFINSAFIVGEHSTTVEREGLTVIDAGQFPYNVSDHGVYYRKLFDSPEMFQRITSEHKLQRLTETNHENYAFRTGLYMSNVEDTECGRQFNLLRCSTNFEGPTDNFRDTDHQILTAINERVDTSFGAAHVNHVLAQVYWNAQSNGKIRKAKIAAHADKTRDMSPNHVIAFTTFYQQDPMSLPNVKRSESDPFDIHYKGGTTLTKLRFRRKKDSAGFSDGFEVTLYPGSVFLISAKTNQYFTHEIVPSHMPLESVPIRMGYIARCSNTVAVHREGQTYIVDENGENPMVRPTDEDRVNLKKLYLEENISCKPVSYDTVYYSMNVGDYNQPLI